MQTILVKMKKPRPKNVALTNLIITNSNLYCLINFIVLEWFVSSVAFTR